MEHLPAREGVEVEKPAAARENRLNKPLLPGLEYELLLATLGTGFGDAPPPAAARL